MNILDIMDASNLRRKTPSELAGPCPKCGGTDRFIIQPEKGRTGRYWCRQCGIKGDAIQYLRDFKNMGYREACDVLSVRPKSSNNSSFSARGTTAPQWEPRRLEKPKAAWQHKAILFAEQAVKNLNVEIPKSSPIVWKNEAVKVRQWLMQGRGLSEETIRKAGLGWNPRDFFPTRKSWGLPDKESEEKITTKMYLPQGLVIPYRQAGIISRIKIRRSNPGDGSRYILLSGSETGPMVLQSETAKTVIIVESELDALLIQEKAGNLVTSIALGNAQIRPDMITDQLLKQAKTILVSLDSDQAGVKESWQWWAKHYPNSKRWPPVKGKDPGEMYLAGVDLRIWVEAGLLNPPPRLQQKRPNGRKRKDEGQSMGNNGSAPGSGQPECSEHSTGPVPVKHSESETRVKKWIMDSRIIGREELVYDENKPDRAEVGGVEYWADELKILTSRGMRKEDILTVHEIKRVFEGRLCGVGQNEVYL